MACFMTIYFYLPFIFFGINSKNFCKIFNPSLISYWSLFLQISVLWFSFASLCTTNFLWFWFFWMASSCTLVCHKYLLPPWSARCITSCTPFRPMRLFLPSWQLSALTLSSLSPSSSVSHPTASDGNGLCWLSNMRAVRGRGGHPTGRPSCDISAAGSGRFSAAGWYYEKLHIISFMWSISLWEVSQPANKLIRLFLAFSSQYLS